MEIKDISGRRDVRCLQGFVYPTNGDVVVDYEGEIEVERGRVGI